MSQPQDNTVSQTTAHKTSQDASRYSDLPEAVPPADVTYAADGRPYTTGPQVVYDRTLPQVADKEREGLEHEGAPVPWWRRRRTLAIAAIVVVCVVVAVVVGGVVESKNSRVSR